MKKDRCFSRRGFTLTEILVVIVIIAILASMAIPRFTMQRGKAATAEAIGIMTAIHRAILQYQDANGTPPAALGTNALIQGSSLGIAFDNLKTLWQFSIDNAGNVTATNVISGVANDLVLCMNGNWTGNGIYLPATGPSWPGLPTGPC